MDGKKLEWKKEYSVEVEELDNQHKYLFGIINKLLDAININNTEENLGDIIKSLIEYKMAHFATEEGYFREFNYEEMKEHTKKHEEFNVKLETMKEKYPKYTPEFAFELIDFLEDWFIDHIMNTDHKYIKCFHDHGLK